MENDNSQKKKVIVVSVITLFVCLIDIYIIINFSKNYIVLAAASFVTLIYATLTIGSWFEWKEKEKKYWEEQYSNIINTEKGFYSSIQKNIKLLDDKINFIGQKIMPLEKAGEVNQRKIASMLDNIVQDQKKIGKITISRSKENAEALMNSNDKLLQQMEEFHESMKVMQEHLLANQGKIFQQESKELGKNKDELLGKIQELGESLKSDTSTESRENSITEQVSVEFEGNFAGEQTAAEFKENPVAEQIQEQSEESSVMEEIKIESERDDNSRQTTEELVAEGSGESSDDQKVINVDNLAGESSMESVLEQAATESTQSTEADDSAILEENTLKPDLPDPNRPMSPEDIAALIANTEAEDLPEETEKFETEEKPPRPDLSDPNKPMSPEDIAALIANM